MYRFVCRDLERKSTNQRTLPISVKDMYLTVDLFEVLNRVKRESHVLDLHLSQTLCL